MVTGGANDRISGNEWQIGDFDARSGVSACHDIGIDSKSTDPIWGYLAENGQLSSHMAKWCQW